MLAILLIILGVLIMAACLGGNKQSDKRNEPGKPIRIDHPRLRDVDEHVCSVCGRRFQKNAMVCPGCGVRFQGITEDCTTLDEELTEEEWDEEEDS